MLRLLNSETTRKSYIMAYAWPVPGRTVHKEPGRQLNGNILCCPHCAHTHRLQNLAHLAPNLNSYPQGHRYGTNRLRSIFCIHTFLKNNDNICLARTCSCCPEVVLKDWVVNGTVTPKRLKYSALNRLKTIFVISRENHFF